MKYVQRRANRYEVRFPLPDELAGKPLPPRWPEALEQLVNKRAGRFKTEVIRSLKTNDPKEADRRALGHIAELLRLVDQARAFQAQGPASTISSEEIVRLARAHEVRLLKGDEAIRDRGLIGRERDPLGDGQGMSDEDLSLYAFTIESLDEERRAEAAKMRPGELVAQTVNRAVVEQGISLHPEDPAWRQLELAFLRAQRSALDTIKGRLKGELLPTPELSAQPSSITLRAALQRWAEGGGRGARKPRSGPASEAARAVDRFVELEGDLRITEINKGHGRSFRDALARVPKSLPRRYGQMALKELLQQDLRNYPPRGAQTVNKALALLGGILARAERDGFFDALPSWSNPFHVAFEIAELEREPYEPLTPDELSRLFASPVYADGERPQGGAGEAAFWFPLIALFSGARRTEIAQLRVCDLRRDEAGIWLFDLTGAGEGQSVKTSSSARHTPVHPRLVELGLVDYHARRARELPPSSPLWPGFEPPVEPKAKAWSKWFARYFGRHVTEDRAKTFHSFRHTFKRACREAGISEEVHNALTGHSGGGVGRSYGRERQDGGGLDRGMSLTRLRAELARVSYPGVTLDVLTRARS